MNESLCQNAESGSVLRRATYTISGAIILQHPGAYCGAHSTIGKLVLELLGFLIYERGDRGFRQGVSCQLNSLRGILSRWANIYGCSQIVSVLASQSAWPLLLPFPDNREHDVLQRD